MIIKNPIREKNPVRNCIKTYSNYRSYKDNLAKDFNNRCGYCDAFDGWIGGIKVYHIDHFAPKSKFPHLTHTYENLIYSCPFCNLNKGDDWPSTDENINIVNNIGYINPLLEEYVTHFYRDPYGNIICEENKQISKYMYKRLKFYLERHRVLWNLTRLALVKKRVKDKMENCKDDAKYKRLLSLYGELSLEFDEFLYYIVGDVS
ncbi:HNH endonuclease [Bacillus sp. B-jedd]|uniref:HNH endonuclease n=1 Tax=Bacillus sp. B-jedd TaxID=1476857 RepID=UPI00051562F3|nr:HNH endonuclease [Bacillus sp. B-jedd]CEG25310.1 HNH endonuclease [Bacillus sp. B-jedd]